MVPAAQRAAVLMLLPQTEDMAATEQEAGGLTEPVKATDGKTP